MVDTFAKLRRERKGVEMGQGRRQFTEEFKREAVGVTEAGLQWFHYCGTAWTSTTGRIIVLYPDEVHDSHAGAPTGFVYSMLYVDPSLIAAAGRYLSVASQYSTTLRYAASSPMPLSISRSRSKISHSPPSSPRSPRPSRRPA
jgi:hypothetical protein